MKARYMFYTFLILGSIILGYIPPPGKPFGGGSYISDTTHLFLFILAVFLSILFELIYRQALTEIAEAVAKYDEKIIEPGSPGYAPRKIDDDK